jgi:hypothetical protein
LGNLVIEQSITRLLDSPITRFAVTDTPGHVARSFSLGVNVGYNAMVNFSEPVGLRDNFNGLQVGIGVGWLFGKGY